MMNQFWLAEMVRQLGRDEPKPEEKVDEPKSPKVSALTSAYRSLLMADLGEVKEELQRLEINLDDLIIEGKGNVRDLFHPSAKYYKITKATIFSRVEVHPDTSVWWLYKLRIIGDREGIVKRRDFSLGVYHNGFMNLASKISPIIKIMQNLEHYFHRRNDLHEKEYNSTYRKRTEL